MSGSSHFAKVLCKLSPLTLETEEGTALPLSQLYHHFIFAKLVPTPSGRASLVSGPPGCHSPIPSWVDPEGPTGSLRIWWDMAVQELPERDPHLLWLKGRNQNNQNQSLLSSSCVLYLSSLMPCRAPSNNASGANKILRNPFLDYSETFIFIRSYQHAGKAHIN